MSTTPTPTPDIMTITCDRPATGLHIQVTVPAELVQILQWIADNTYLPQYPEPVPPGASPSGQPPVKKYLHVAHVIYRDAVDILVRLWKQAYTAGVTAQLQQQLVDQKNAIEQQAAQAVASLQVVEGN